MCMSLLSLCGCTPYAVYRGRFPLHEALGDIYGVFLALDHVYVLLFAVLAGDLPDTV